MTQDKSQTLILTSKVLGMDPIKPLASPPVKLSGMLNDYTAD